jgi:hypothetical protein
VLASNRLAARLPLRVSRWLLYYGALFCGAMICTALVGCGEANPYLPVTGTVKFDDGTVPQGEIASITFQPKSGGIDTKGAQGTIESDGSFQLNSEKPGDGAKPGEYAVIVHIMIGYPDGKSVVPRIYTNPRTTPLSAEVKANGENHFEFAIEKP